jgi:hypothetical protein
VTDWPALDYASGKGTYETCHLVLQLVGKLPTRLHPWINHGWHVALRVTPCGFVTRTIPAGERLFNVELDMRGARLVVTCDRGDFRRIAVPGRTIADLHGELSRALAALGLPAPLHGGPNEIPDPVPFARDTRPREWRQDAACAVHCAFLQADRVFNRFRSLYLGKSSPSHLFWGSFDVAVTRFSGRRAPRHPGGFPHLPDEVTREAYSHEVISAGFWLGGNGMDEAAFYAYAYPSPDSLAGAQVSPGKAFWHDKLGEFVCPYRAIAEAPDPDAALTAFLQSTFDAAAEALDWPRGLALQESAVGRPPRERLAP